MNILSSAFVKQTYGNKYSKPSFFSADLSYNEYSKLTIAIHKNWYWQEVVYILQNSLLREVYRISLTIAPFCKRREIWY